MHSTDLANFLSAALEIPTGTVLDRAKTLRASDLLTCGKQGRFARANLTSADAVNSLIANTIDRQRGESVADAVQRVRALRPDSPPLELPQGLTRGLSFFHADNAGAALESLIDDMRSGRLAEWAAGEPYTLAVTFDARGASVFASLDLPKRYELDFRNAICGFAQPGFAERVRQVERNITVGGDVFERLADALGPPD
jgi:hypothetical protein